MPYVLISTQIRMEVGPTMVGDEHSDQHLMDYLGAIKRNMLGNHFLTCGEELRGDLSPSKRRANTALPAGHLSHFPRQ
ncbi:GTP cyclohydrolase 1 feedback regulatory protein isoform X3 [Chrysemys picta bellii]|uniref:GTP cyclohydrolase 1 feedback regulatory protein isoform X3 n=1 Tax=Chrysemys picta bellii TaxID=8478 RepID=UPI0032B2779A